MYTKKILLNNYRIIAAFINSRNLTPVSQNDANAFAYKAKFLYLKNKYDKAMEKQLETTVYLEFINNLAQELSDIKSGDKPINDKVTEQKIRLDMLRFLSVFIYNAIQSLIETDSPSKYPETIYNVEIQLEETIKRYFDPNFYLPAPFSLANIRMEYDAAYEQDYGQGCIGFFKLPIKRFFQQKTRDDELKFLESIEEYCQNNSTLSEELSKQLKLSAANLVLLTISAETFGKGSQLGKILQTRMRHTGQLNDLDTIMDHFLVECSNRGIEVPLHLKARYEKEQERNDTAVPAAMAKV